MSVTRREFVWTMGAAAGAGALYRFQDVIWAPQQAWVASDDWEPGIESRIASACLLCPARCGIEGRIVDGRLVRILGNSLHPMSQGGLCPRGIAGVQTLYHPQRVESPLVRIGARGAGVWRPVTPAGALTLLAERLGALRTSGRADHCAVVAGYCEGTMRELWHQFLHAFGSRNYVADEYGDGTETVMELMHGIARRPAYDLDRAALVLSFGAPLFEAWWSPLQAYVAFGRVGRDAPAGQRPRFIQVDTRFSRTAARAHEWVGIRPDTYAALALGMAYVLIKEELVDADFLARHVNGFEEYRTLVLRQYRTEEVSAVTGVPIERIVALAKAFGERRPAVAVCGSDVTFAPDGLLAGMAVHSLNVLTAAVNRPGGVLFPDPPPLRALVPPQLDVLAHAGLARPPLAQAPPVFGDGDVPGRFAATVADGESVPEVLLLYYANPLASSSRPELWRRVVERIPFVVSFSPFLDETTRFADLVLPDLLPYERWQDAPAPASYPYPVWGLAQPLVAPRAGAMHTGEVLLALAKRHGGTLARSLPYADVPTLLKLRARGLFAARRGMTLGDEFERRHYSQMEERGWWLAEHDDFETFWSDVVAHGGWTDLFYDTTDPGRLARTPDGRIALMPDRVRRALAAEGRGRTLYATESVTAPGSAEFPLRLMPYRVSTLASGTVHLEPWLAEQPALFPDTHWIPWVEIHPSTAAAQRLRDGALVWVVSARGRYRARLRTFPGTPPEHVGAPYGLRHPSGELANPLQLLDGASDDLTGLPAWFTTFVRLEPAAGPVV